MSWHDLLIASRNGDEKKLLKLLANTNVKLQLNQLNQNNFTALHLSMVHHHYTCALLLLEAGADPYAGAPHNSLLDTYTAAQRLMLVKLFLYIL